VKTSYPEGPTGDDYTSIINERHYARLKGLIDDARAQGAQIIEVGNRPVDTTGRSHTLPPTIVLGVTDHMRIAHEEIFGPILPILPYRDADDAIAYVNARPRPLALYYFGGDNEDRRKVLSRTTSGNVTINGTIMHVAQDDLPFGGLIASGFQTVLLSFRLFVQTALFNESSLGSPGIDELRWLAPVRPGDTIHAEVEALDVKPSRSKPDRGIAQLAFKTINQHGETVASFTLIAVLRRSAVSLS
jgi:acyl dehydratase